MNSESMQQFMNDTYKKREKDIKSEDSLIMRPCLIVFICIIYEECLRYSANDYSLDGTEECNVRIHMHNSLIFWGVWKISVLCFSCQNMRNYHHGHYQKTRSETLNKCIKYVLIFCRCMVLFGLMFQHSWLYHLLQRAYYLHVELYNNENCDFIHDTDLFNRICFFTISLILAVGLFIVLCLS